MGQVNSIRKVQKKIGTRKLLGMLNEFMRLHKITIGRDEFFELLRDKGLLVRKRKRFKPQTTFSNHYYKRYENLIIGFVPTAPNQLWVSDITYIHLEKKFAYLNLITDAYSRKIVGFSLFEDLSVRGTADALEMAIDNIDKRNEQSPRLIHHSDRGMQYCSHEYTSLLKQNFIAISMTQTGDPRENPLAERVNGILKDELLEEVYPDFNYARSAVALSVATYNHQRPHSSVDMLTPFKAHQTSGELKKHWKTYYKRRKEVTMT